VERRGPHGETAENLLDAEREDNRTPPRGWRASVLGANWQMVIGRIARGAWFRVRPKARDPSVIVTDCFG
jgi:hypothetical protein